MIQAILTSRYRPIIAISTVAVIVFLTVFFSLFFLSPSPRAQSNTLKRNVQPIVVKSKESPWFAEVDVSLLRPHLSGGAFACKNGGISATNPVKGTTESVPMRWRFGFDLGLGRRVFNDQLELFGKYSYYGMRSDAAAMATESNTYIPLKGKMLIDQSVKNIYSKISLLYNNLDLSFRKDLRVRSDLDLVGSVGLKNSWLNLKQETQYRGGSYLASRTVRVLERERFWGIGPRVGLQSKWLFFPNVYLRGDFATAMQYGIAHLNYKETLNVDPEDILLLNEKQGRLIPSFNFALGLGTVRRIERIKGTMLIDFSYVTDYYFRINEMIKVFPVTSPRYENSHTDFSMQGFVLRFGLQY